MASANVKGAPDGLDTVEKNKVIHDFHRPKNEEPIPTTELGVSSPQFGVIEKNYIEGSEKFFGTHAGGDSKSENSENTETETDSSESNDSPDELTLERESSTLILVTDLTVPSTPAEEATDDVEKKSSFNLLRLATSLAEPSETSVQNSGVGVGVEVKKTSSGTTRKRTLLNELKGATDDELKEEIALIRANHLPRRSLIHDLVYWREPVRSGCVFGTTFTLLLATTKYSLVSVVGYAGLVLLFCGMLLRIFSSASQRSANLQRRSLVEISATFREENIRRMIDIVANHFHPWVLSLRRLLLVDSVSDSLQLAGALYSLTYIGALIDGLWLMLIAVLSAFTLPLLYERHKERVDARIAAFQATWDHFVQEARNTAKSPLGKRG